MILLKIKEITQLHDLLLYDFNLCYNLMKKPLQGICPIIFMISNWTKNHKFQLSSTIREVEEIQAIEPIL